MTVGYDDRNFINEVANKIWYIEDQQIKAYPGSYSEYENWQDRKLEALVKKETSKPEIIKKSTKPKVGTNSKNRISNLKKRLKSIEDEIDQIERKITEIEEQLSDPNVYANLDRLSEVNRIYDEHKKHLEDKNKIKIAHLNMIITILDLI